MSYATIADLTTHYSRQALEQLTDERGEVLGTASIDAALVAASAEIDGYLAGRYALPLADVPPYLAVLACDLAWYRLLGRRPGAVSDDDRKRYEDAQSYLRRLARGEIALARPASSVPAVEPTSAAVVVDGPGHLFGRTNLRRF